jgi:hypothetical protein
MPTKNPEYNKTLVAWGKVGEPTNPYCEGCGDDLTDCEVIDTGMGWYCQECAADPENHPHPMDLNREDFCRGT